MGPAELADGVHWIELKHWHTGLQKGQAWRPVDFTYDLEHECRKLGRVADAARRWVACLCTPDPGRAAWTTALKEFNAYYRKRWRLVERPGGGVIGGQGRLAWLQARTPSER